MCSTTSWVNVWKTHKEKLKTCLNMVSIVATVPWKCDPAVSTSKLWESLLGTRPKNNALAHYARIKFNTPSSISSLLIYKFWLKLLVNFADVSCTIAERGMMRFRASCTFMREPPRQSELQRDRTENLAPSRFHAPVKGRDVLKFSSQLNCAGMLRLTVMWLRTYPVVYRVHL